MTGSDLHFQKLNADLRYDGISVMYESGKLTHAARCGGSRYLGDGW